MTNILPWCGECDPYGEHNPGARWVETPDGRTAHCPRCHPSGIVENAEERCEKTFPRRYRHARADHPEVIAWSKTYIADPENAPSLLLLGVCGTGKTHQAYGALRRLVVDGGLTQWIDTTAADLYAAVRPGREQSTEDTLDRYRTTPLLLLDDLGAGKGSEWTEEITYRLIDHRYRQCLPSIFTSNLPTQAPANTPVRTLKDALGDRITSRLAEMCTRVVLSGEDRRRARAA